MAEGAAGSEIVGSGASGCGNTNTICLDGREVFIVTEYLDRRHGFCLLVLADPSCSLSCDIYLLGFGPRSTTISLRISYVPSGR